MPDRLESSDHPMRLPSLDEIIEAFEIVWNRDGLAQVEDFLPDEHHPGYASVALELLCVDLERRWKSNQRKPIDAYCRQFCDLLANARMLERLAFEEYRCRRESGESATPEEYARRYTVPTDHWPDPKSIPTATDERPGPFDAEPGIGMDRTCGKMSIPDVGDRFLDFEIVERLGESKLGRVYLATQANLADRWVVIKVATDVRCESERLARLQHSNVVPIYSVHRSGGLQAVCMPYLGRQTLADLLLRINDRSKFTGAEFLELLLPPDGSAESTLLIQPANPWLRQLKGLNFEELCAWIAAEIAGGLAHAHERGILHRDLKPANILLTHDGQPMILDFNLSEDIVAGGRASLLVGGTLPYMAPEHVQAVFSDGHIDVRSDVYSLGVIFFQMLTGRLPFPTQDRSIVANLGLMIKERETATPSVRKLNPRVSPALQAVVRHCLSPDPSHRYQTANQLQEDLQRHLQDYPLRHAPDRSPIERMRKWSRRHPRFTSLGALATVATLALAIVFSLYVWRGKQLARLDAIDHYWQFEDLFREARGPLSFPLIDDETLRSGWIAAEQALAIYAVESPDWRNRPAYRSLDRGRQTALERSLRELLYLAAGTACRRAQRANNESEKHQELQRALRYNRAAREQTSRGPAASALLMQAADIEQLLSKEEEALRLLRQARELAATDTLDRYLAAVQLVGEHRYTDAIPRLTDLVRDTPRHFFAWFLLGNCHYSSGDFVAADACFSRCAALWPESHVAYFQRGVNRLRHGRFAHAERDFAQSLERFPAQTTSLLNRALALIELKRFREAVDDLTLAIERGRDHSLIYLLRSKARNQLGADELAKRDLEEALRRTPVTVDGWIQRGMARRLNDPEGAVADLDAALAMDPRSRKALQNKAYILAEILDRPAEAIETFSRMLAMNPRDASALAGRAILRAHLGDREQALEDAQNALKQNPSARMFYRAACIFAQTSQQVSDDAAEAVRLLGEATKREIRWSEFATQDPQMRPIAARADFSALVEAAAVLQQTETTLLSISQPGEDTRALAE